MTVGAEQITLRLFQADGQIVDASLTSTRSPMAARMLEGKTPEEACALIGLLFSLCATAQQQSALHVLEKIRQQYPTPMQQEARTLLLLGEGIGEHVTRILVDWAAQCGLEPAIEPVRTIRTLIANLKNHIFEEGQNDRIGGAPLDLSIKALQETNIALHQLCDQHVFAMSPELFFAQNRANGLQEWIFKKESLPTQCLAHWQTNDLLQGNWTEFNPLILHNPKILHRMLESEAIDDFLARPTWEERTCQTGPIARQAEHPLIRNLGPCALSFLAAKLIDLAQMLHLFECSIERLNDQKPLPNSGADTGIVEAVRGELCHQIRLDAETGKIARYRILAPTEWNFHPDGILKKALIGLDSRKPEQIKQIAETAVLALDPCVGATVIIEDDPNA